MMTTPYPRGLVVFIETKKEVYLDTPENFICIYLLCP